LGFEGAKSATSETQTAVSREEEKPKAFYHHKTFKDTVLCSSLYLFKILSIANVIVAIEKV
jgi:hypothetical protein